MHILWLYAVSLSPFGGIQLCICVARVSSMEKSALGVFIIVLDEVVLDAQLVAIMPCIVPICCELNSDLEEVQLRSDSSYVSVTL